MNQVHDQKRKELKALLESALQNFSTLENQLKNQLMHNADQVFFVQNGDGEKLDPKSLTLIDTLKVRQQTLVSETLRRIVGRLKPIQGGIREALNTVDKIFPQENGS